MRIISTILILTLAGVACKGKTSSEPTVISNDTIQFYQVSEFVKGQVEDVEKTPYFIYKKMEKNGKVDSTVINNREFTSLAQQFIEPNINKKSLKQYYTETTFFDQTTNTYTLNYATRNKELEVQNIDVLLKDDATTLKRIFIRKFLEYGNDSTAIEQLSWHPDEQFQVSRMVQKPGQPESITQTTVVWNTKN